ncbi:Panacea domain-containing protein [Moraxella oblonga]|uniref:Panacea domain-containing protein n=1 Tax=Moraxella oblonga TaxID=200413 RepID=UPI00082A5872|nr:type II toxin-antitoxin system antitoxin SocA domain-containing protein [Moraxella oblonga]
MANIKDVANYLIALNAEKSDEGESGLTNLKLQKLAYYAQGFYGAIYDKPLFEDSIEAWTHGPVIPSLYQEYKHYGSNPIPHNQSQYHLTNDEMELIQEVYDVYGQFSAWRLRDLTHNESPWINHERQAEIIPFKEMKDFFKTRVR